MTCVYFHVMGSQLGSVAVEISRTGYSGDLGYEVWCEAAAAPQLWDLIWEAGMPYGLVPAGILALDVARVEAGLLLLDVDYTSARGGCD
ncbi:aminomethyltransferase [Anaerolineaceae bacterium]|nr:aminomethyltransferase [Anaerolineaceae bacterium]